MIPGNAFLSVAQQAAFLLPESLNVLTTYQRVRGGIALADASQNRDVQDWFVSLAAGTASVGIIGSAPVFTLAAPGAETISLAFDTAMRVSIAWQVGSVSNFYAFDTTANVFNTRQFTGTTSCRLVADDVRTVNQGASDVLLFYTAAGQLLWRQQRDNYTIERTVGATSGKIYRAGRSAFQRMQIELQ